MPRRILFIGVIVLAATAVHADVVMSNLAAAGGSSTLFGPSATTIYKAYGWTMGNDPYYVDSVTLRLFNFDTGEARVSLWTGNTVPTTEVLQFNAPPGQGAPDVDYTFTPVAQYTLAANTRYFVYVEEFNGGGNGFSWRATSPSTDPSGVGTSFGYVFNGNPSTFRNALEIQGTLVPEPASLLLLGAALLLRRR